MFRTGIPVQVSGSSDVEPSALSLLNPKSTGEFQSSSLQTIQQEGQSPVEDTIPVALVYWQHCIELYTKCHLIYEEGILVAISAIAQRIQPIIKSKYVAGLWESDLPSQLLWLVWHPKPLAKLKTYRAPSWSWASVKGYCGSFIKNKVIDNQCDITVLSTKVENRGPDPMGQVIAGSLKLRCWLKVLS